MNKATVNRASTTIRNFKGKLGETVSDLFFDKGEDFEELAKNIITAFSICRNKSELEAANYMLAAVCGYNLESIIQIINDRDFQRYQWENIAK